MVISSTIKFLLLSNKNCVIKRLIPKMARFVLKSENKERPDIVIEETDKKKVHFSEERREN